MRLVRDRARYVIAECNLPAPLDESDLDRAIRHFGGRPRSLPRHFEVPEFRHGRYIAVRLGEPRQLTLWYKAHGLAHLLLHRGDHETLPDFYRRRQEYQAHEFAGWLLCGGEVPDMEPWEIAEHYGIPYWMVHWWLERVGTRIPVATGQR